jgi:hypothetical protein
MFLRDGVGTLFLLFILSLSKYKIRTGCQGFKGPFPSAFLDKKIEKNWRKDKGESFL